MFESLTSEITRSPAAFGSGFFSRRVRMTSTRSFGRMKPPAPVSGEISVDMARIPCGRIAAMKPDPLALISFGSRIGSPAIKGERAIEAVISLMALERSLRRMKELLAVAAGHVCHDISLGVTVWPRLMSDLATRTSTVCNCATGSGGGGGLLSDPLCGE